MASDLREQLQSVLGDAYTVEREIAGGGMSRLFVAAEHALRRLVVVKVLPRERVSEQSTARFRREIELAAALQHPHILPVYSAAARGGLLYYTMPYVAGESLRQRLEREGPLPVDDALRLLRELADGLAHAHQRGVIHRDVKPANVLLADGHALLADFGIARALAGTASGGAVTGEGVPVGTPGYMAPEQAAGEPGLDARADVYALALVGYEMLAGSPPFSGGSLQSLLVAHLTAAPAPLQEIRREVPARVSRLIERALAKAPEQRVRSALEFRDALDAAIAEPGPARSPPPVPAPLEPLGGLLRGARAALRRLRPTAATSLSLVAVLPFAVRGSERLAYLREGMVDLLSAKLGGAGELRCVDPRALLALVAEEERHALDPARAWAIAQRLGAGLYVLGTVVEVGGRVHLSASLYDLAGTRRADAQCSADSDTKLFELVDELAIRLLSGHAGAPSAEPPPLASSTTHSLPALKAYLEGERHYRAGLYTAARDAFTEAVGHDAEFALAWYRLSVAAEWVGDRDLQDAAANRAVALAHRLSERDRRLLEAFVAWRRGLPEAEELYRAVLAADGSNVEAWFQLGEVQFHYGPLCGRSVAVSRDCWERVLRVEPRSLGALYHLTRVAAVEGRREELEALTDRVLALSPESERALEARALRAFFTGDEVEQRHVLHALARTSDAAVLGIARTVAVYLDSPRAAAPLLRVLTAPERGRDVRALAHAQLAWLEATHGRWRAARVELARAEPLDAARTIEARGQLAVLPFAPFARDELEDLRAALAAWRATADLRPAGTTSSVIVQGPISVRPHVRAYLLGMLDARLRAADDARQWIGVLRALGAAPGGAPLGAALAADLEARLAVGRGDVAAAVETLERTRWEVSYVLPLASPALSRAHARFLLGTLLAARGRPDDAQRWLASFGEAALYDLVYLAPAHLERARLCHAAGDAKGMAHHVRLAAELWSECDVEPRAMIDDAMERLDTVAPRALSDADAMGRRPARSTPVVPPIA